MDDYGVYVFITWVKLPVDKSPEISRGSLAAEVDVEIDSREGCDELPG